MKVERNMTTQYRPYTMEEFKEVRYEWFVGNDGIARRINCFEEATSQVYIALEWYSLERFFIEFRREGGTPAGMEVKMKCPKCKSSEYVDKTNFKSNYYCGKCQYHFGSNDQQNPKPKRVIKQIVTCMDDDLILHTALCNDGTVWEKADFKIWQKLPDIPQDEEERKEI